MPTTHETAIFSLFLGFIAGFLIFHGFTTSKKIKNYIAYISAPGNYFRNKVFLNRLTGFICFFIFPVLIVYFLPDISFNYLGVNPMVTADTFKFGLLIAVPLVLLSALTSKSHENLREYPQIRKEKWGSGLLVSSALTWILYLFAYEFTFRGILLFVLIEPLGLMPAIAINTVIYAIVHVPKSFREAVGSVPLGIVLCLAAWKTQGFMVAFIAHCFLALSNEWLSLYHHPEMTLNLKKQ